MFRHKSAVILQPESTDLLTGSSERLGIKQSTMYTLNFPNGNVRTYSNLSDLQNVAKLLGGEAKQIRIGSKEYVFIPKK